MNRTKIRIFLLTLTSTVFILGCHKGGSSPSYKIGQSHGGGIIFFIEDSGLHGLICAPSDQSTGVKWADTMLFTDGTTKDLGDGQTNTNLILANLGMGNYPAYLCHSLLLNGYNDWYLPSCFELEALLKYLESNTSPNLKNANYWSSTDIGNTYAYSVSVTGASNGSPKTNLYAVRAIRSF